MNERFPSCTRGEKLFNHRPMVISAIGLCCGILLGRLLPGLWGYIFGITALPGYMLFKRGRLPGFALCMLFMGFGILRIQIACPVFTLPEEPVKLSGTICQLPDETDTGYMVILKKANMDGEPLPGKVLLNIADQNHELPLAYGQHLQVEARLYASSPARNEGGFDQQNYDLQRGIICRASGREGLVLKTGRPGPGGLLLSLRQQITATLCSLYGDQNGALASGILLGETDNIVSDTMRQFRDSGITHILAVSGLHVSMITGILLWLLKKVSAKIKLCTVSLFLFSYAALCGFSASILRAAIMAFLYLLCQTAGHRYDPPSALGFSAILLLLVHPFFLFSAGFLLSYSAVLGIFLLHPIFVDRLRRLPKPLSQSISISCSAQLGTLAASAGIFHTIPLMSVLTNIIAVPLTGLVLLPSFLALMIYPISPLIANGIGMISDGTLTLLSALAEFAADFPLLTLPAPPLFAAILLLISFLFLSRFCLANTKMRTALFSLCLTISLICWSLPTLLLPQSHVTVLDVPYGYAAHIHTQASDTLIGTEQALKHANVTGYCSANNIQQPSIKTYDTKQLTVDLYHTPITLSSGEVYCEDSVYRLSDTGQLRIWLQDGELRLKAYIKAA